MDPISFAHGPAMPNRLMLAPLTNRQSHADGTLSDDEHRWLTLRAQGGFGLTMTCAAHVQAVGQGFGGQLGVFGDEHLPGLTRLAADLNTTGTVSYVQLHHAGMRSPADLIGTQPVCPSEDAATGARALTTDEVEQVTADFVAAARRAQLAGFHGVELHGAHGYLICQFLSPEINRRADRFGGSLENRSRLLFDIVDGIRAECGPDLALAVRLSSDRFGIVTEEMVEVYARLIATGAVDLVDMSLWAVRRPASDGVFAGEPLLELPVAWRECLTRSQRTGETYFTLTDASQLQAVLGWLVGRGVEVRAVTPQRNTLEELFMAAAESSAIHASRERRSA